MSVRKRSDSTVHSGTWLKEVLKAGQGTKAYRDYYDNVFLPRTLQPDGFNTRRGYKLPPMPDVQERMTNWEFEMRQQATAAGVLPDDPRPLEQQLAAYDAEITLRNEQQFMSEYEFSLRTQTASNVLAMDVRPIREQQASYQRELLLRRGESVNLP